MTLKLPNPGYETIFLSLKRNLFCGDFYSGDYMIQIDISSFDIIA